MARARPSAPPDDRGYLPFMAAAIATAVGAGFLLAVYVPFAAAGFVGRPADVPFLIQAHGAAQLQGWAGLFVAGMAFRLAPRLAGRRPVDARVSWSAFALLTVGLAGRVLGQAVPGLESVCLLAGVAAGAGMLLVAGTLAWYLVRTRRPGAWTLGFAAGAFWWVWWAAVAVWSGLQLTDRRFLLFPEHDPALWTVMLGCVGNFIWAVQSRSVPTFFGRQQPPIRRFAPPWAALNLGLLLVAVQVFEGLRSPRLEGIGFALAGAGTAGLSLLVGAFHARAHRLRPRARPAARYVAAANWFALAAAAALLWGGVHGAVAGAATDIGLRDAARHLFGVGTITMLIVGVAQLIAPIFALGRAEPRPPSILDHAAFWGLVGAAAVRAMAGILSPWLPYDERMTLAGIAGLFAWFGVARFAWLALDAYRNEERMLELLARGAAH